jgi:hypothetical protein
MFSSNSSQVSSAAVFVEEIFQTYLYTGTGAALTITNGIDLSTKGGLVWLKDRAGATSHRLYDTQRGVEQEIYSNQIYASTNSAESLTAFNTTGFTVGQYGVNSIGQSAVSWTFREQPKFFDVVTYTGDAVNGRAIPHALGSVPGCIIVKTLSNTSDWLVYHRSLSSPTTKALYLNATNAELSGAYFPTTPTSTVFYTNGGGYDVNDSGRTYVAYLFAHDAGGFGLTGTDNVISCGSFTTDASGKATINLGYEPQWVVIKNTTSAENWFLVDVMRGFSNGGGSQSLAANTSSAEQALSSGSYFYPNQTGFVSTGALSNSKNYIYIAIRRGPMKVPTLGTSVYTGSLAASSVSVNAGFVPDLAFVGKRDTSGGVYVGSRLQGSSVSLNTYNSAVEAAFGWVWDGPTKTWMQTSIGADVVDWLFARAPSVCDVVCYTGTGVRPLQLNHNLGAVPELMIVKIRATAAQPWFVYSSALGNTQYLSLNTTAAFATSISAWSNTTPTSTTFTVGDFDAVNGSTNYTYVAYLFATCAGVSKVGTYTGNGTTQTIDCGFGAGGARWVMIKRTDSTGSWYVYDTARGMTVLTDPYLLMNSNAAEVATLGSVTTVSTGFALNSTILAAINVSAGSYIFLAIA